MNVSVRNPLHLMPVWCVAAILVACSSPAPVPRYIEAPRPPSAPRYTTSFDCNQAETPWQVYVCRDATLAAADVRLHETWVRVLPQQDQAGRAELLADQRHWQRGLYARCRIEGTPVESEALPQAPLSCLQQAWQERTAVLQALPLPVEGQGDNPQQNHPLAAYVEFREAESIEPTLCGPMGEKLNGLIARHGRLQLESVPGWRVLASSRAPALMDTPIALPDGKRILVQTHNSGPYGSYETRATGMLLDGRILIDETTVPDWVLEQPNAGGSFVGTSSQTGDYASLDVLLQDQRVLVLVNQTWGYYASAARGESPHSALYELSSQGMQRRCLWRTYTTPPVANSLRFLPQFKTLQDLLDTAAGPDTMNLAPRDRRDAGLLYQQLQWEQLNLPLLGLREANRFGRWPRLRQRHDEALEAVFAWSERNVACKQLYRRLMPLIPVAHAELVKGFEAGEGMKPAESRSAADLILMTALARAAEHLQDPAQLRPALVGSAYRPRYAVVPQPGDLEKDRPYGSLHSALLNRATATVIDEFMRHTWGSMERVGDPAQGLGPAGDTPLMAAVRSPEMLQRLIQAGADINARNAWGKTALMTAAQANQIESVQRLLQAGADVNARTVSWQADGAGGMDNAEGAAPGRTTLHFAAASAQSEIIEALVRHGALPKVSDSQGATPCTQLKDNEQLKGQASQQVKALLCVGP